MDALGVKVLVQLKLNCWRPNLDLKPRSSWASGQYLFVSLLKLKFNFSKNLFFSGVWIRLYVLVVLVSNLANRRITHIFGGHTVIERVKKMWKGLTASLKQLQDGEIDRKLFSVNYLELTCFFPETISTASEKKLINWRISNALSLSATFSLPK